MRRTIRPGRLATSALLLAALSLVACGSGGRGGSGDDARPRDTTGGNAEPGDAAGTPVGRISSDAPPGRALPTRLERDAVAPGLHRYHLSAADLPAPRATPSAVNPPRVVPRPNGARVSLPPGFEAIVAADGFSTPRELTLAPNGDVVLAESGADRVLVLRDADGDGRFERRFTWFDDIEGPFGLAVTATHLYVAGTDRILRFRYAPGDTAPAAPPEYVAALTGGGYRQHWTRNLLYDAATNRMYVTVGSRTNADEEEPIRAAVHTFVVPETLPDGGVALDLYASGLRNPVGLAREPVTGTIWTAVNERDGLGDDLVPDYATGLVPGGFYGWPYAYIGPNPHPGELGAKRPDLVEKTLVPDVLFESHSAALGIEFYTHTAFPERWRGGAFVALHGSWNRSRRTGYKVVYLPFENGRATGAYEDFMVGFSADPDAPEVWGRPVGILVDDDGTLLVSDDGGDVLWRVRYTGN
jgi:glucose/arabinose dehydrogenase